MGYTFLATMTLIGFLASLACHIMAWLNIKPPGGETVFILHFGIFLVWIPLVIAANRTKPASGRNNLDHLYAELPKWVGKTIGLFGAYAVGNFIYFIYCSSQYPKNGVPFYVVLRGFSGHWMVFYGMAAAGFIGLSRYTRKQNG